jgi:NADPH:quinone reductase-like Zn-dependent oxidoreductase
MKAILCSQYCQPDDLVLADIADPVAEPGQAVIAIKSAALNFFDILMIRASRSSRRSRSRRPPKSPASLKAWGPA